MKYLTRDQITDLPADTSLESEHGDRYRICSCGEEESCIVPARPCEIRHDIPACFDDGFCAGLRPEFRLATRAERRADHLLFLEALSAADRLALGAEICQWWRMPSAVTIWRKIPPRSTPKKTRKRKKSTTSRKRGNEYARGSVV